MVEKDADSGPWKVVVFAEYNQALCHHGVYLEVVKIVKVHVHLVLLQFQIFRLCQAQTRNTQGRNRLPVIIPWVI